MHLGKKATLGEGRKRRMSSSKKRSTKGGHRRPVATSAISQPTVQDASDLTALSSFSPNGDRFAFLSLAVDKHRLRVYSTLSAKSVAEHVVDSARVSSLSWCLFDPSGTQKISDESPNKKKRRKGDSQLASEESQEKGIQVVILGLSDGAVSFFSPNHGRVLRTLSHPTSTAEIVSVVSVPHGDNSSVWTSGADGAVRIWNAQKNEMLSSWRNDDRIPYFSLAPRPVPKENRLDVLAAHHSIHLLSTSLNSTNFDKITPTQAASFTGHASPIRQLKWDASRPASTRFVSRADTDRFLYLWGIPEGPSTEGKPLASIPLDSDARTFSLSSSQETGTAVNSQTLLALSASGKISLFPIPTEIVSPASSGRTQHKLPTLLPRSILSASVKNALAARIIDVTFSAEEGNILIARTIGGIRPVFDVVVSQLLWLSFTSFHLAQRYLDPSGDFIPEVVIEAIKEAPPTDSSLVSEKAPIF